LPLLLTLLGSLTMYARLAAAASGDWNLNAEAGGGTVISADQRHELSYGTAAQGSVRPGLVLVDPLVLQLAVSGWWFPSSAGFGQATLLGAGLRFEPFVGPGRFVVDGHGGLGRTGGLSRFMFDAGLGYEWSITESFGLGPMARYGQLAASTSDGTGDAKFWSIAISLTLRPAPPPAPAPAPRAEAPRAAAPRVGRGVARAEARGAASGR
jgi:hypothetical protein